MSALSTVKCHATDPLPEDSVTGSSENVPTYPPACATNEAVCVSTVSMSLNEMLPSAFSVAGPGVAETET